VAASDLNREAQGRPVDRGTDPASCRMETVVSRKTVFTDSTFGKTTRHRGGNLCTPPWIDGGIPSTSQRARWRHPPADCQGHRQRAPAPGAAPARRTQAAVGPWTRWTMTIPACPQCQSKAVGLRMPDSPEVLSLHCRRCGHEWEVLAHRYTAEALTRLGPLPHWR